VFLFVPPTDNEAVEQHHSQETYVYDVELDGHQDTIMMGDVICRAVWMLPQTSVIALELGAAGKLPQNCSMPIEPRLLLKITGPASAKSATLCVMRGSI
jgi:hypothetical protein